VWKVAQARKGLAFVGLDRRLRMRAEQLVAPVPEAREGIGLAYPVEITDPAAPVDEIEQRLCVSRR
jgi:hypothetical protein